MDEILGWSTRRFRTAVIYQPCIMSLILLQTSTAGQEHLTLQQPNLYIKEWNLHFYWGLVEMETSVVENPICFFQALDLLSLQEVWLRGQRRQRGDWGWCPCSQWILSLKCLGPPTHCLIHLCFPNTSTYLLLNKKRWMNDWGWLTGCFKFGLYYDSDMMSSAYQGMIILGKNLCSQFPRGRACHIVQGPQREAPAWGRRQKEWGQKVGKSRYCGFCGKKWVRHSK